MDFKQAYELPIGGFVEKKGRFSYMSWAYAVKFLRENLPEAQWIIHENADGLPFFILKGGAMVKVSVVVEGAYYTQWHPILNNQNKPIPEPNPFEINTSIQRCLTKAIGLATGIGLGLYAGEDLPTEPQTDNQSVSSDDHEKVDWLEKEADKNSETLGQLSKWYISKKPEISKLSQVGQKQFNTYVSNLKDVLNEKLNSEA